MQANLYANFISTFDVDSTCIFFVSLKNIKDTLEIKEDKMKNISIFRIIINNCRKSQYLKCR